LHSIILAEEIGKGKLRRNKSSIEELSIYWIGGSFMYNIKTNELGEINVAEEVVETIAGLAAVDCYGLVGMVAHNIQSEISSILGRESIRKGVEVSGSTDGLTVDVHVIVGYGIKISQVAFNIMQKVKYVLENSAGLPVAAVNVNVRGVKVLKEK
jgi:uncharacterized alkaline shock family protein YloU